MAYRPYVFTSTAAAQKAVSWDPKRTNLVITNVSGETCYMGVDATVSNAGTSIGAPIFNNGRFEAAYGDGTNPTIERWLVGTAGGSIIIFEEFTPDPYLESTLRLNEAVERLITLIGGIPWASVTQRSSTPAQLPTQK